MAPCGGIFGILVVPVVPKRPNPCFQCNKSVEGPALFVEEWDAIIHRECLGTFLTSDEGKIVMEHGHQIIVPEQSA